jgi:hypothetical protein
MFLQMILYPPHSPEWSEKRQALSPAQGTATDVDECLAGCFRVTTNLSESDPRGQDGINASNRTSDGKTRRVRCGGP